MNNYLIIVDEYNNRIHVTHTSSDWYQIVQKSKNTKTVFFHIFLAFLTFQNLNYKNTVQFFMLTQLFDDIKGFKVSQNRNFTKIPSFLLNNNFWKTPISQKPAKTGSWFFLDCCYGLYRIQKYQFLIRLFPASYLFDGFFWFIFCLLF